MKKALPKILLVNGLAACGVAIAAANTHAQTVNVDFPGIAAATCTVVGTPVNGAMRLATGDPTLLTSNAVQAPGASDGSFTLNCTNNATISFGAPTQTAGPTLPAAGVRRVELFRGATSLGFRASTTAGNTTVTQNGPINNVVYTVRTSYDHTANVPIANNYNLRATFNITAN